MAKRVLLGFVYAVVLYFVGCVGAGMIAGGMAGVNEPNQEKAAVAGAKAGEEVVERYGVFIGLGAIAASTMLTALGVLPGTKPEPVDDDFDDDFGEVDDLKEV